MLRKFVDTAKQNPVFTGEQASVCPVSIHALILAGWNRSMKDAGRKRP